ncbi:UBP1-associated protein 2C-like [Nymphaea colorata]|nr:UBP1-associated protein 2C-like [Nymphaea colorata]
MDDLKKRKIEGEAVVDMYPVGSADSPEELRLLLEPLKKEQLVDLLIKFGSQNPSVAEGIRSAASADPVHRKLFVRGLAWETTSETLCAAFGVHGEIEEGAVIIDKATGKSRGYGFITYRDMESAQRALREPSKLIDGRMAVCNLACEGLNSGSAPVDQAQRKLYIGGLSLETTSETLLNFFARHGDIEEGSVAYDKETNKSRGFGFITYKTAEAAKKAIDDPNKILDGKLITVKFADSQKNKFGPTQLPAAMVPVAISFPAGYTKPGTTHVIGTAPIGYAAYQQPQPVASFPTNYANTATDYSQVSQVAYASMAGKGTQFTLPAVTSPGVGSYHFYAGKH